MSVNSFENYVLSWKPHLGDASEAKYLELAAELEEDILSRRLKPGTRLPPQRELADYLGVNFTTVTRAYDVCRLKGLIYGVVGRGTFVASEVMSEAERQVIDLGVVEAFPEIGASEIVEAAKRVLARGDAGALFDYSRRDGRARPIEAALKWLKTCGIGAGAEQVAVFPGTQSALSVALLSLFRPGDKIAVDAFTYANLKELACLAHIRLAAIEGDEDGMRPGALENAAEKSCVKGVFLMPCAANPTGITMSVKRREEIAAVCERKNLVILEDDSSLSPKERRKKNFFTLCPERTLYLSGATRYFASGLRVAYAVFPRAFAARLLKGLHHLVIKASSLESETLCELILSGAHEKVLKAKERKLKEMNAVFDGVFGKGPRGFFRTIPLPGTEGRGAEIEERLLKAGIRVCHSDRFAVGKPRDAFLRVSVSSEPDPARLLHGLRALRDAYRGGLSAAERPASGRS